MYRVRAFAVAVCIRGHVTLYVKRVKYATQVFNDTMNVAFLVAKHFRVVGPESEYTANFVKDMDNLFDTFNSFCLKEDKIKLRYAMSKDSLHEKILTDMKYNLQNSELELMKHV